MSQVNEILPNMTDPAFIASQLTIPNMVTLLMNSLSPDHNIRAPSEATMSGILESQAYPQFYYLLSSIIADESINHPDIRVLASILLKNNLISSKNNTNLNKKFQLKWFQIGDDIRDQIKENVLIALSSKLPKVANSSSQAIAAIAFHELGANTWNLLPTLVNNTANTNTNELLKRASLLCIGYICEQGITSNDAKLVTNLRMNSDSILTGLVQGCQDTNSNDPTIKLTAINSLIDALDFIDENMARDQERNFLMQVVCEMTQSPVIDLKIAAFGCLCKVMSHYYYYMKPYMEQAIYMLAVNGLKDPNEDKKVKSLIVELWSTICEEEIDLKVSLEQYPNVETALQNDPKLINYNFSLSAINDLIPIILNLLIKGDDIDEEEDFESNEWDVTMSAGACLQLFANNCGNYIMELVLMFVQQNLSIDNWRNKEAAIMAFGCILDGPDPNELNNIVSQALQPILMLMENNSVQVKETVSWCIGRIIEFAIDAITSNDLPNIVQALLLGFKDHPRIITNCCWSLMNLIERVSLDNLSEYSKILNVNYPVIVEQLMIIVNDNSNENEYSCRSSAFAALTSIIENLNESNQETGLAIFNMALNKLLGLISTDLTHATAHQKMIANEYKSSVLSILSTCIRNLPRQQIVALIPSLCNNFVTLLEQGKKYDDEYIEEDVFYCLSSMTFCLGSDFKAYLQQFAPYMAVALSKPDTQACVACVGLIGDVASGLGTDFNEFGQQLISKLGEIIQSEIATNDVILQVISTIGEIATSLGTLFQPYLSDIAGLCNNKFLTSLKERNEQDEVGTSNYDTFKYFLNLHAAILDCYVGIIAGFVDAPELVGDYIPSMFDLIESIYMERAFYMEDKEYVLRSAIGLVGDISMMYPNGVFKHFITKQWVVDFINYFLTQRQQFSNTTIESALWTSNQHRIQQSLL
ncbi:ARM repeat-containing protein [Hanseniaspora valbyensis NRRL Y-1626]|uniref:ARM repeat-containing protein n=1 Tax=Hanseniaspora valbyensis NRRL Y-1626 TaxID=766949 RepID=A0A1B7TA05_9ASCO|nr:ARM repeat-containing protein [Hanseniaspora valbyensis NRRL Y-1626]